MARQRRVRRIPPPIRIPGAGVRITMVDSTTGHLDRSLTDEELAKFQKFSVIYVSAEARMKVEDQRKMERLQAIRAAGGGCNHEDKALLLELLDRGLEIIREGAAHLRALEKHVDELTAVGDALAAEVDRSRDYRACAETLGWCAAKAGRPRA